MAQHAPGKVGEFDAERAVIVDDRVWICTLEIIEIGGE